MNAEHISAERLYEAAEGIDLQSAPLEHLRNCAPCQEILRIMTRHIKTRLQNEHWPRSADGVNPAIHVSLVQLWLYRRGTETEARHRAHILACGRCRSVLAICRRAESIQDTLQELTEQGFEIE